MMPQIQMTNEQFALWIATQMIHSNLFETGDAVYKWLESKKPQQAELKHYLNGVEVPEQYWDKLNKTKDSDNIHDRNNSTNG